MTMIDVDTSPLQAAREWRGIGLVAAAVNSGLPMAQAEALEEGDPSAFGSIDEMIAAAVVYGATIGIGRDEAMALLDRTVCGTGAQVQLPTPDEAVRPNVEFSGAVQERSARISQREVVSEPVMRPFVDDEGDLAAHPVLDSIIDEPVAPSALEAALPTVPEGPSPEQAVAASGELHLDSAFGPEAPWERGQTGELAAWVDDFDAGELDGGAAVRLRREGGLGARLATTSHAVLERVVGTERADAASDWTAHAGERMHELTRDGRERLRRSEHATLFVAIGGGAILIAILVALGGALGGSEATSGLAPIKHASSAATASGVATKDAAKPKAAAPATPTAMIPPARLTLDIFNAGSKKGYAKEVAAKLEAAGYRVGEVTNSKGKYSGASIIHPADMAREAKLLSRRTGITTLQVSPGSSRRITIVVT